MEKILKVLFILFAFAKNIFKSTKRDSNESVEYFANSILQNKELQYALNLDEFGVPTIAIESGETLSKDFVPKFDGMTRRSHIINDLDEISINTTIIYENNNYSKLDSRLDIVEHLIQQIIFRNLYLSKQGYFNEPSMERLMYTKCKNKANHITKVFIRNNMKEVFDLAFAC